MSDLLEKSIVPSVANINRLRRELKHSTEKLSEYEKTTDSQAIEVETLKKTLANTQDELRIMTERMNRKEDEKTAMITIDGDSVVNVELAPKGTVWSNRDYSRILVPLRKAMMAGKKSAIMELYENETAKENRRLSEELSNTKRLYKQACERLSLAAHEKRVARK